MKLKLIFLSMLATCCLPFSAQAETVASETSSTSDVSLSEPEQQDFNYDSLSISYEEDTLEALQNSTSEDTEVAQRTRRTRRSRRSNKKYYVGANIGLLIPFNDGPDVGFGLPSVFGGVKFNQYFGGDLEFFNYLGGTETDDLGYFAFGFLANARVTYPFSQRPNSLYAFASPGIGYGRANPTGDAADNFEGSGGFTFQIKTGLGYPVSDNIDVFGQLRYLNIGTEGENSDGLTIDAGATYKF